MRSNLSYSVVRKTEQTKDNYAASIISNQKSTYWLIPINSLTLCNYGCSRHWTTTKNKNTVLQLTAKHRITISFSAHFPIRGFTQLSTSEKTVTEPQTYNNSRSKSSTKSTLSPAPISRVGAIQDTHYDSERTPSQIIASAAKQQQQKFETKT